MVDKDKDIYNIGASTRKILFNFLDELKDSDGQDEGKSITKSKKDVKLFSGKLSENQEKAVEQKTESTHKSTKEFVLSKDEEDKLKLANEDK
ncbi:hypothetical protein [Candidatus Uabimicrobium amorphum]|uniref:Uncharacterized protein n=1 Tax=Uabimicrobium amorphum TaxID=2596890 RepID=A0A5S9IJ81_UABAM|nr:hypothetical protein [Candidatus Uabimicrobium amorphum]BBM82521.1 hypothetical protein UABAM_00864 [Candidatus Uabimicrobium amorphum]